MPGTTIHFLINEKSIEGMTWEEFETFERAQEGDMKLHQLRPILARFLTNGNDKPMPHAKAMKVLGELPIPKIKEAIEAFVAALKDNAVPKVSGDSSSSPLEASPAESESPDGSGS